MIKVNLSLRLAVVCQVEGKLTRFVLFYNNTPVGRGFTDRECQLTEVVLLADILKFKTSANLVRCFLGVPSLTEGTTKNAQGYDVSIKFTDKL